MKWFYRLVAWFGRRKGERLARKREARLDKKLAEVDAEEKKLIELLKNNYPSIVHMSQHEHNRRFFKRN